MNIGRAIKNERVSQRWGLIAFARRCGLTNASLGRIERNVVQPKKETLESICAALGVSKEYIFLSAMEPEYVATDKREAFLVMKEPMLALLR